MIMVLAGEIRHNCMVCNRGNRPAVLAITTRPRASVPAKNNDSRPRNVVAKSAGGGVGEEEVSVVQPKAPCSGVRAHTMS